MVKMKLIIKNIPIILIMWLFIGCRPNTVTAPRTLSVSATYTSKTVIPTSTTITNATITPSFTVSPTHTATYIIETTEPPKALLQLTYVSNQQNGSASVYAVDVYCFRPDTNCLGQPKLLFEWNDWISGMDWSPDGEKVTLSSGFSRGVLYITDWNGKNSSKITELCGTANWPKWSPDGSKIAFIYADGINNCEMLDNFRINTYDLTTEKIITILPNAYYPSRTFWLPQGEFAYISEISKNDTTKKISIVKIDGTIISKFPTNAVYYTDILDFAFSSDGQKFAFVIEISLITRGTTDDIYVIDRDTLYIENLTHEIGTNLAPTWSPQGDFIAFESDRNGNFEIYLVKPDGTGLMQVTSDSTSYTNPAWRVLP